jgi:hypothetical protein
LLALLAPFHFGESNEKIIKKSAIIFTMHLWTGHFPRIYPSSNIGLQSALCSLHHILSTGEKRTICLK